LKRPEAMGIRWFVKPNIGGSGAGISDSMRKTELAPPWNPSLVILGITHALVQEAVHSARRINHSREVLGEMSLFDPHSHHR